MVVSRLKIGIGRFDRSRNRTTADDIGGGWRATQILHRDIVGLVTTSLEELRHDTVRAIIHRTVEAWIALGANRVEEWSSTGARVLRDAACIVRNQVVPCIVPG